MSQSPSDFRSENLRNVPFFYVKGTYGKIQTLGQARCLLGHKIAGGPNGPPDGVFAEWQWDGKTLTVQNDKYGYFPLFCYHKDSEFCVSPSIVKLLEFAGSKEFDYPALSVFIRLGFFLKEDTAFQYIKIFPPSAHFCFEGGRLSSSGEYLIKKPLAIQKDAAIDVFIELFRQAIKKRLPVGDDFIVPVSGGRDSRRILLELNSLGIKPKACVTHYHYPTRNDEDVRIASILTRELGIKHIILEQGPSRFQAELKKNILTSFCSDEHSQTLVMADYLSGKTPMIYDGIAGFLAESFLLDPKHVQLYREQKFSELAHVLLTHWSLKEDVIKSVLNEKTYQALHYDVALGYLVEELKSHAKAANPIASFHFYGRTRREIALNPFALLSEIPVIHCPYLDHDLCKFLLSLPAEITEDSTFHVQAIQKAYPKFAHIPFEDKHAKKRDSTAFLKQLSGEFILYYFAQGGLSSRFIRKEFVLPRIARSLFSADYKKEFSWIPSSFILYFIQLEDVLRKSH